MNSASYINVFDMSSIFVDVWICIFTFKKVFHDDGSAEIFTLIVVGGHQLFAAGYECINE